MNSGLDTLVILIGIPCLIVVGIARVKEWLNRNAE